MKSTFQTFFYRHNSNFKMYFIKLFANVSDKLCMNIQSTWENARTLKAFINKSEFDAFILIVEKLPEHKFQFTLHSFLLKYFLDLIVKRNPWRSYKKNH